MSDEWEWDCRLGCGFGSDSALRANRHEEEECPNRRTQQWLDGYQAALDAVVPVLNARSCGALVWSKDPTVIAAAVDRFDAWRSSLDDRFGA